MGMNLSPRSEEATAASSQQWLGSAHGTDVADGVTLDTSTFVDTFEDGKVPSGVVVSEGGDGRYVYGGDGGGKVRILLEGVRFDAGSPGNVGAAVIWHGQVLVDELPTDHGLTATPAGAMPLIDFVGDIPADPA